MKMKNLMIAFLLCFVAQSSWAQSTFWKESFSSNKLPAGWIATDNSNTGKCQWMVTDQPYPGSFQFNQQQPPIASTSRGFHLQYRPGVITGDEATKWRTGERFPDASVQTAAIDCSAHSKVVLRFQENFRWNDWFAKKESGLYVGVSNDGKTWKEFNMKNHLAAATTTHKPLKEEIDISKIAGNQKTVYIRFSWRGLFSWFWMIDDIELGEPLQKDLSIEALTSHQTQGNKFSESDTLRVKLKNLGSVTINEPITVTAKLDGQKTIETIYDGQKQPLAFDETCEVTFPAVSLKGMGSHKIEFSVTLPNDQRTTNNNLSCKLYADKIILGDVTAFHRESKGTYEFESHFSKAKLIFYTDDIFRFWVAPDGEFTNPTGNAIVTDYSIKNPTVRVKNHHDYYLFTTKKCAIRVYKKPMRIALYDKANKKRFFEEKKPLRFGNKTSQLLLRSSDEHFYGGGMQHGSIDHTGTDIDIEVTGWDDKQSSNPAPFYISSYGYGVFRNTFKPGKYYFSETTKSDKKIDGLTVKVSTGESKLMHKENRFDAFYFVGPSLKHILDSYTATTGRPFMPAAWMLTMGDSDCYNNLEQRVKWTQSTPDVISQIADEYIAHDMPRGWILPNDGYGCGYVKLDSVVDELSKRGFHTGLWTENGVEKLKYEVGTCGTRLCKLDVAWIGEGYDFALNGCKSAFEGIEKFTNERGFVWSVCGWAGTQRYSTVWSGDQSSDWKYLQYHVPTIAGAGMSGFNAATSDIDGIFGGSAPTYTRDLQWKCFTPIMMVMSGWANVDRQPWLYGHPYETINRNFLRLKMRMIPYQYSYCHEAHKTGVPMVRPMVLEFPQDSVTYDNTTQYQFMSGEWLMVAPVYTRRKERKDIYFPAGTWYDFWSDKAIEGDTWMKKYKAPLDICPVFVREGAIIPMWPQMNYVGEKSADELTLKLWPATHSEFNLYEDDLLTRDYEKGESTNTKIEMSKEGDITTLIIHAMTGSYNGCYENRSFHLDVYMTSEPQSVTCDGETVDFDYKVGDHAGRLLIDSKKLDMRTTHTWKITK